MNKNNTKPTTNTISVVMMPHDSALTCSPRRFVCPANVPSVLSMSSSTSDTACLSSFNKDAILCEFALRAAEWCSKAADSWSCSSRKMVLSCGVFSVGSCFGFAALVG